MSGALKEISKDEVSKHNNEKDLWVIIDSYVYDLTKFVMFHPGGRSVLLDFAGKDATAAFYEQHRSDVLRKYDRFKIGKITGAPDVKQWMEPGEISKVPFSESSYWLGYRSPYYKESHVRMRKAIREFLENVTHKDALAKEEAGEEPGIDLYQKLGKFGYLTARIGPGQYLKLLPKGFTLPGGVKPEEFDYFHEMIAHEEMSRLATPGWNDGLGAGMVIGLPPVIHFGTNEVRAKVVPEVLAGNKRISLAISEAFAGSDVANIRSTAVKSADGSHYIVNGTKKWITNGNFTDYFVTAVRTGGKGMGGISLLLIERGPGVNTEKIKTSYSGAAGTAYITFDNVKVPVGNLLGKENRGFECIMYNFNHERWLIIAGVNSASRMVIEECFKWANQRRVFGKPLIDQPVIRQKLAQMVAALESVYNWQENVTYQMTQMSYAEQSKKLAGPIALLKYQATRVSYLVSDNAVQIFGGRGITRTGMGYKVEHFQRALKFGAILGGSEEILADLGIKQAMREFPKTAKL